MREFAMKWVVSAGLVLMLAVPAFADKSKGESPKKWPEPTKEQRQKMADMHEKMATCLRSDKTMKECHQEMMQSCKDMGEGGCPMMKHHGMHGHGHDEGDHSDDK